ncbi:MAG: sterol desaturase family protein [Bacteroidia bacterium]
MGTGSYSYFTIYLIFFLRYMIIGGIGFLTCYILFRKKFNALKIQQAFPKSNDYIREISYSVLSLVIITFCVFSALNHSMLRPHTRVYSHISQYGWVYFFASIFLALLIHDTYFYWTHRLMHHPKLFRLFHLVHHRSINPTPWAAYAFHPLEAVVEGMAVWAIVFTIPIHPLAIAAFGLIMITYNVYGHLGYEIYPKWLINSRIGKWLNTSTNHNMHHKYFNDNYGLYFRFWDEIMKTTNPKYKETIDELVSK